MSGWQSKNLASLLFPEQGIVGQLTLVVILNDAHRQGTQLDH